VRSAKHFPIEKKRPLGAPLQKRASVRVAISRTCVQRVRRFRKLPSATEKPCPLIGLRAQAARERHLKWWEDRFAGFTLAGITTDRIVEARDALAAEKFTRGKPRKNRKTGEVKAPVEYSRSPATINKYLTVLTRVLSLAVKEWRLMDRNPAADISKKKEPRGRVRFLTDAEREALLEACAASDWKALHTLVLLAISTGARRGELVNLQVDRRGLKGRTRNRAGYEKRRLARPATGWQGARGGARSQAAEQRTRRLCVPSAVRRPRALRVLRWVLAEGADNREASGFPLP